MTIYYQIHSCKHLNKVIVMASSRRTVSFSSEHPCFSEIAEKVEKSESLDETWAQVEREKVPNLKTEEEDKNSEEIERILNDDETLNRRLLSLRGSLKKRRSGSRESRCTFDTFATFYTFYTVIR